MSMDKHIKYIREFEKCKHLVPIVDRNILYDYMITYRGTFKEYLRDKTGLKLVENISTKWKV